jgi:hypothetical protein
VGGQVSAEEILGSPGGGRECGLTQAISRKDVWASKLMWWTSQRVHRDVLNWLKEWDKCVFKRVNPGKKRRMADENDPFPVDILGRPREKVGGFHACHNSIV